MPGTRAWCHLTWPRLIMTVALAAGGIFGTSAQLGATEAHAEVGLTAPNPGVQPPLLPAPGEFVSVPMYRALDTRNGTGESGGPAQLNSGSSMAVTVTGIDGVPSDATSVVVNIVALNATADGYLTTYDPEHGDSNVASVEVKSGINSNQTDTIPVSSAGTVSVANHSPKPLDVVMSLMGYYTGSGESAAGDTYGDAPWVKIVDTVNGVGTTQAPIPAGGTITLQVSGQGGIALGPDTAVLQFSASNASQSGFLTTYAAGATDPGVSALFYDSSMIYRDLIYVPLSSDGKIKVTNHGAAPVGLVLYTRGYFMPPASVPVGAEYVPVGPSGPVVVLAGSSGGGAQLAGNASVTFQVAGAAGLPATGLVEVAVVGLFFNPQVPPVPSYLQTTATYTTTPSLSGVIEDSTGDDLTGEIFLFDSSGNPIGGAPTATGVVSTGERVSWPVTAGTLTDGATYQWYMEACDQGVCSNPSPTQTFTINAANAPQPPAATANATLTGSSLSSYEGVTDPAGCSGSDCVVTTGGFMNVGFDGTSHWASSLKLDLSSIPAGSTIVSATLQLTSAGCLSGTGCATSAIDVYPAQSAIGGSTTGVQLAAAAIADPHTATAPATQGTWDITGIVDEWMAGDLVNNGLVVAAPTAGTAGLTYYSPGASTSPGNLPNVTIGYIPPTVPDAPTGLTVTPGDGGALVQWSPPSWNYNDDTSTAIRSFTVKALTSAGAIAATQTTSGGTAVITGLADGSAYTFTVTATNALGIGAAATSTAVTPSAVPGGTAEYVSAASQFLNAQNALNNGTAVTASGALSGDSMMLADTTVLSNENIADATMSLQWTANDELVSNDTTTLSNSLVMLSSNGTTVTTYATATETYTITDTSGTTQSYTTGGTVDYMFTFTNPGSSPQMTGYVDANAAAGADSGNQTAFSDILDGPAISAADANAPAPIPFDSSGQMISGSEGSYTPCGGTKVNCSGVVTWAKNNLNGPYPWCCSFTDDCTNYASRALRFGGGQNEVGKQYKSSSDDHKWYVTLMGSRGIAHYTYWSHSWSVSRDLAQFFRNNNAHFMIFGRSSSSTTNVKPGMIIWAALGGGWFGKIDHAGIVVKVMNRNVMIAQHSRSIIEPLWKTATRKGWFGRSPHLQHVWIGDPSSLP